jgi:YVTN family beta-propeller protein
MNFTKTILAAFTGLILFSSCEKNDDKVSAPLGAFDNGILVLNQGNFGSGNAAVSFLQNDFSTSQNNIFATINPSITLGDTAQDIGFYNDLAFIVVNGSNKIEIVNRYTFIHVASINLGLNNPRYIAFCNGKGYVTNWGDGTNMTDDFVAVLNLENYAVSATIPVVEGPEKIVVKDKNLYVAHQGGYGFGNSISVINATSNTVLKTINVGDVPNSLRIEGSNLYVLCAGKPSYADQETNGAFVKINLTDNMVTSTLNFLNLKHPANLNIYNSQVYYNIGNQIFKTELSATTLPTAAFLSFDAAAMTYLYNFEVENNSIFAADAMDFNANGKVYIYSLDAKLQKTFTVGIAPAGFYFN